MIIGVAGRHRISAFDSESERYIKLFFSQDALDQYVRRAADRIGLRVKKSRWRRDSVDNCGGFQIIDPVNNHIVAGEKFNLLEQDVIDYCTPDGKTSIKVDLIPFKFS